MRIAVLVLIVAGLAGCLDGTGSGQAIEETAWVSGDYDGTAWSLQLCDEGLRGVQLAGQGLPVTQRSCDFRVTKPLLDSGTFDWHNQHGPGNEVSLAVNPTNPLNLAGGAKDYTVSYISDRADCGQYTVWNGHYWSHDGGRTWSNDLIPGFPGDPRDSPLQGNLCNTDPVSVFDSDGTYWHNGLNYRGAREDVGDPTTPTGNGGLVTGSQIFFARSQDGGDTFDRITFGSYGQNDPGIFNDKNWLAVDPFTDHMIHTWTNFYAAVPVIEFIESFDGGATWTHPLPLSPGVGVPGVTAPTAGPTLPTGQFSMPQYDGDGNLWVIWSTANGPVLTFADRNEAPELPTLFTPTQTTVQYPSGGLNGGADGCLAQKQFRASVYPVLGVDASDSPFRDRKYIAYPANGVTGAGIWVTSSDDASTWTTPVEVTAALPNDQFMSWLDVGPDGTVHVAYYDCSVGDGLMHLGYVNSRDGGATWSKPMWVSQEPFDGDLGHHQSGAPFIGDYIAVDATAMSAHFFWADTRHGRSDVYAATLLLDGDAISCFAPEIEQLSAPNCDRPVS